MQPCGGLFDKVIDGDRKLGCIGKRGSNRSWTADTQEVPD